MEKRKLDFILKEANLSMKEVDQHFARIDKKMKDIHVGLEMIDIVSGMYDNYPVVITKIVDKENGIVEVFEKGYSPSGQYREMNIDCLSR